MEEVLTINGKRLRIGADGVLPSDAVAFEPVDLNQVQECVRWFERAEATGEPAVSSFWLKHVVQHSVGSFVSNGAVIVAAHRRGFPIDREPADVSANVKIGVATHCIDEYDCGCGHP